MILLRAVGLVGTFYYLTIFIACPFAPWNENAWLLLVHGTK